MIKIGTQYLQFMGAVYSTCLLAVVIAWIYWSIGAGTVDLRLLVRLHNQLGPGALLASWLIGTVKLRAYVHRQHPGRKARVQYAPPRRTWPVK